MALAREAAPHIRKQGEKILPKSMKEPSADGKSTMDGVIEVAASGLKGNGIFACLMFIFGNTVDFCYIDFDYLE